jgi:hypothetical protein
MSLCKSSSCVAGRVWTASKIFLAGSSAILAWLLCTAVYAQTPAPEDNALQSHEAAEAAICSLYGCSKGSGAQASHIGYDPCYLAQNAMRPCTSDHRQVSKPVGVDPNLVGVWELPFKGGPWVLTIHRSGAYEFRSEARDGARSHAGTFSANNGHWSLKAKTGYTDAGDYLFQAPDIWIATGKLGAAAWLRPALAQNAMRPCTSEQHQLSKPVGVDPNLVGTWELPLKGGLWIWEILRDGTYKFHSEARDGAPSHAGTFSADNGHWSLQATTGLTGYTDAGLYLYQAPNIWIATGRLGSAAWLRPPSQAISCNVAP